MTKDKENDYQKKGFNFFSFRSFLLVFLSGFFFANSAFSTSFSCNDLFLKRSKALDWLISSSGFASRKILNNISPTWGKPGSVIAAQTRSNPNYGDFHWIRDAALTIESLLPRYQRLPRNAEKLELYRKISDYVDFSAEIQNLPTPTGLGEPKVFADGRVFTDPWGRPQNDSPALRALSMIHIAQIFKAQGKFEGSRRDQFYISDLPAQSAIKKDLEYVAHHWRETSFDLWEEVNGLHFYTLMVQRKALLEGAEFARTHNDPMAAHFYRKQAQEISQELLKFWDEKSGFIQATRKDSIVNGMTPKDSNLDSAVILGLLHGSRNDGFFSFSSPQVLATLEKLEQSFKEIYPINKDPRTPGTAIGRYPEDTFAGHDRSGGNPWVLCTLGFAEAYYRAAQELNSKSMSKEDQLKKAQWIQKGDEFVTRVEFHAQGQNSLSEQIQRETGQMTSVEDLTWSYAALLTALEARQKALR